MSISAKTVDYLIENGFELFDKSDINDMPCYCKIFRLCPLCGASLAVSIYIDGNYIISDYFSKIVMDSTNGLTDDTSIIIKKPFKFNYAKNSPEYLELVASPEDVDQIINWVAERTFYTE